MSGADIIMASNRKADRDFTAQKQAYPDTEVTEQE